MQNSSCKIGKTILFYAETMKKLVLLLPLLFFVIFPQSVALAQTAGTPSATASQAAAVNYTLPYPGLLPDNPLYFLKVIRDDIVMFFISDPAKKSDFLLLQGDKRLEASWYLLQKGSAKYALALSTLSKSTNYIDESLGQLRLAKTTGEDVSDLQGRLHDAIYKHAAVVAKMMTVPGLAKNATLATEAQRLRNLENSVDTLIKK